MDTVYIIHLTWPYLTPSLDQWSFEVSGLHHRLRGWAQASTHQALEFDFTFFLTFDPKKYCSFPFFSQLHSFPTFGSWNCSCCFFPTQNNCFVEIVQPFVLPTTKWFSSNATWVLWGHPGSLRHAGRLRGTHGLLRLRGRPRHGAMRRPGEFGWISVRLTN